VAILGGLIGLGGAEFRLPILIAIFALYPHRAIRINLLISFVALAVSAVSRLSFLHTIDLPIHSVEIVGMLAADSLRPGLVRPPYRAFPKRVSRA
jgi:uncharacterized membrane protein YfcA